MCSLSPLSHQTSSHLQITAQTGTTRAVFSDKVIPDCEKAMRVIGYNLTRQSDRSLPRTYFRTGYVPAKSRDNGARKSLKRSGQEIPGIILVLLLFLLQTEDDNLMEVRRRIGTERIQQYALLFTISLLHEEWLKQPEIPRVDVEFVDKYFTPHHMDFYKAVVDRTEGDGLNIYKFHAKCHLYTSILFLGVPRIYTGHFGEANFKFGGKNLALRTQRRNHTLDKQTADRSIEYQALLKGHAEMLIQQEVSGASVRFYGSSHQERHSPAQEKRRGCRISCTRKRGSRGVGDDEGSADSMLETWATFRTTSRPSATKSIPFGIRVESFWSSASISYSVFLDFVNTKLALPGTDKLEFFTEYRKNNILYKANPINTGLAWQDLAYCDTDHFGLVPVHLLLYVTMPESVGPEWLHSHGNLSLSDEGLLVAGQDYAIVHYFEDHPWKSGPDRRVVYDNKDDDYCVEADCPMIRWGCKSTTAVSSGKCPTRRNRNSVRYLPTIMLIPTKKIVEPCIAIQDTKSIYPHLWYFVLSQTQWADAFMELVRTEFAMKLGGWKDPADEWDRADERDRDVEHGNDVHERNSGPEDTSAEECSGASASDC